MIREGPTIPGDLGKRMRGGVLWSFVGSACTAGATFVSGVVVATCVGREAFGRFSILRSTLVALAALAPMAMGLTATKFTAELRDAGRERLGKILGLCAWVTRAGAVAAAGGLWLAGAWISRQVLHAPDLEPSLRWVGVAVGFLVLASLPLGALAGLEAFRPLAVNALVAGCVTVAAVGIGARWAGVSGAAVGLGVSGAAQWALANAAATRELSRRGIEPFRGVSREELSLLERFALPAALGGLSMMTAQWVANALLARRPGGYDELGVFGAANTIRSLVVFVPGLVLVVSVAVLNQQRGAGNAERYHRVYWTNLAMTGGAAIAAALAVVAFGPPILRRFGPRFEEGYSVLVVLTIAAVLECSTVAAYQLVQAEGRMWRVLFAVVLPRDVLLLVLAFVLTKARGALGLAEAYATANALGFAGAVASSVFLGRVRHGGPAHAHAPLTASLESLEP